MVSCSSDGVSGLLECPELLRAAWHAEHARVHPVVQGGGHGAVQADGAATHTCPQLSAFAGVMASRGPDCQESCEVYLCVHARMQRARKHA